MKWTTRLRGTAEFVALAAAIALALALFAYVRGQETFQPWLTLLGGLTIVTLLTTYLRTNRKRPKRIEQLVEAATAHLKASEGSLKAVFDNTMDAIITIGAQGTIELVNPAAETMFGYSARDLVGQNINLLMPEPHRSDHDSYISGYLRTGDAKIIGKSLEINAMRKAGTEFPIRLSVNQ